MSETDSFINEVSEEVRRDKLFGYIRRYGWIAVTLIVVLVGGAAWNEINKARATAAAQAAGDALMDAMNANDDTSRATALAAVDVEGPAAAVSALLTAAAQLDAGEGAAASDTLSALATDGDVPEVYRDLAAFKAALADDRMTPADRRLAFEALAVPGATFALLAQEQLALLDLAEGQTDDAVARLRRILEDAGVTRGLRERAQTLIVALGEEVNPGAAEEAQASE